MRLLLYNIRYAAGSGWRFHFPFPYSGYLRKTHEQFHLLVEFIKSMEPDIIGLLEVDSGSFRSSQSNQAEHIARELEHYYVYQCKYHAGSVWQKLPLTNKQGNAFLTNMEIKTQKFHYFDKGIKRLMIELELKECIIFLVHLSIKFKHRHSQLDHIKGLVKSSSKPVIVAGDFNSLWGREELDHFLDSTGLINANEDGQPSHPSHTPVREIDFILHSPQIKISSFKMPQVKFSDHIPLVCDFDVNH